jgi:hypothetical protein
MLAYIYPIEGSPDNELPEGFPGRPDNSLPPGRPNRPSIGLPPLPGIWPPPGKPSIPTPIPPDFSINVPANPIYIEDTPDNKPITLPPGTIWPPLPPSSGIGSGTKKVAILVWVVGVGARWFIYDPSLTPGTPPVTPPPVAGQPLPPTAAPK